MDPFNSQRWLMGQLLNIFPMGSSKLNHMPTNREIECDKTWHRELECDKMCHPDSPSFSQEPVFLTSARPKLSANLLVTAELSALPGPAVVWSTVCANIRISGGWKVQVTVLTRLFFHVLECDCLRGSFRDTFFKIKSSTSFCLGDRYSRCVVPPFSSAQIYLLFASIRVVTEECGRKASGVCSSFDKWSQLVPACLPSPSCT